jgi:hypothetical protein
VPGEQATGDEVEPAGRFHVALHYVVHNLTRRVWAGPDPGALPAPPAGVVREHEL